MASLLTRNIPLALLLAFAAGTASATDQGGDLLDQAARAGQAYNEGKWEEAEKQYLALTRAVPKNAELWFRLGNAYVRQDRLEEAMAAFGEALKHDPAFGKSWYNLAIVHLRLAMEALKAGEAAGGPGPGAIPPERLQAILEAALARKAADETPQLQPRPEADAGQTR